MWQRSNGVGIKGKNKEYRKGSKQVQNCSYMIDLKRENRLYLGEELSLIDIYMFLH